MPRAEALATFLHHHQGLQAGRPAPRTTAVADKVITMWAHQRPGDGLAR
jgi:hypothetical protein